MKVSEALRRVGFKVGTLDDINGKAINPIINNRYIIDELNSQMRQYANVTKGIEDIYSTHISNNDAFCDAPSLALRSESYRHAYCILNSTIFNLDIRGERDVYPIFRVNPIKGVPNWIMPWNEGNTRYIRFFPMISTSAHTTTLSADISISDTTIPVSSTTGFVNNNGRITIESEKILYQYKDATNFYGCVRGVEQTTAAIHTSTTTVTENNLYLIYSRLPQAITITDDSFIDQDELDRDIEIIDEHMEGVIKATAYNLCLKIDPERAIAYKADYDALYLQYKRDIVKGYGKNRNGANVRNPYKGSESGIPFGSNFIGY